MSLKICIFALANRGETSGRYLLAARKTGTLYGFWVA